MQTLTAAETAKLIRQELKATWPAVKFTVHSSNHSGGSSVRVGWLDGPTEDKVHRLMRRYGGAEFDVYTDCKEYAKPAEDLPQSISWLSCRRGYTLPAYTRAVKGICDDYGLAMPRIATYEGGYCCIVGDPMIEGRSLAQFVDRALRDLDL